MDYRYSILREDGSARSVGMALPISHKKSVEVCRLIRGKSLGKSIELLGKVMRLEAAVPYKRYNRGGVGHRRGIGVGRFPVKTCAEIIKILKDAQANAQSRGLQAGKLVISHISAQKAAKTFHYGRKSRRVMKKTHIEVVVKESK
ncbi:50S ribosomal protein L22 [Candidatus Woesearchaeota archaeon]|nr:50S ribosomal protein L22 [Candidatus Woesearchaeota archaeon]